MKTQKKLLTLFLILCCVIASTVIATKPVVASEIQPMYEITDRAKAELSISSGGNATCSVYIHAAQPSYRIEVVMSLMKIGQSTPLKSWSTNGTGSITYNQSYYVSKGHDYRVSAAITIKDSNGKFIDSFSLTSPIVHY